MVKYDQICTGCYDKKDATIAEMALENAKLRAINAELVKALKGIVSEADFTAPEKMVWTAKGALAKAKGMDDE